MARRPVPILVVPKPGLTVRLHGVVVPALGLETTVDDELANELLEGTLDDYPVPYHPPPITGGAAAQSGGLAGAAAGSMLIAGSAGTTGFLSLASNQPPSTLPSTPAFMLSGAGFSFSFTQTSGSQTVQMVLLSFNTNLNDCIELFNNNVWIVIGGVIRTNWPITRSLGQAVTLAIHPAAGTFTVSGATTGNGTVSVTGGAWSWPAGILGVGRMSHSVGTLEFPGTLSDIAGEGGGATLAGLTALAGSSSIGGSAAASQAGLTGAASGAARLAGTAAGAQAGLVGSAAQATAISGTAAGAQSGLAGVASGALRVAGTGAGAQSGLTGAASGSLRVAGTGAGAQAGLVGAATGGLRLAGSGAGAQAGLVGSAAGVSDELSFLEDYLAKNLFSWMRADTRTEASSRVTQFTDRVTLVGNVRANARTVSSSHAFVQSTNTSAAQVAAITTSALLNSKEAALFTTTQFYDSSIAASNWKFLHDGTGMQMWAALAPTVGAIANDQTIATTVDTVAGMAMFRNGSTQDCFLYSHDGTTFLANPTFGNVAINVGTYLDAQIRVSDTPDYNYRLRTTSASTGNLGTATPASINPDRTLRIGYDGTAGRQSTMALSELMVVGVIDATLLTRVQRYMLLRYGL